MIVVNEEVKEEKELISTKRISLRSLMEKAENIQKDCSDYYITGANDNNFRIDDEAGVTYMTDDGEVRSKRITKYALGQLCNKIGVPSQYIRKCINTGRLDLAQENISSWISDYNRDLFIREHGNKIRGVLTQRFSTFDTPEILEVIDDTISSSFDIKGYYLSPERFHLRMIDNSERLLPDSDLFAGVTIDSSDVGRSTLSVKYFVYKQVCSNGLCIPQSSGTIFQQKHIGITVDDFKLELKKNIELIPEINARVASMINESMNSGKIDFDSDTEIDSIIKMLRRNMRMSEEQSRKVIDLFRYRVREAEDFRYDNNNWGFINAITEFSKDTTLERRIELERLAGNLLVA